MFGFHGTRGTNPETVLNHVNCFDVAYANPGGAYNAGLYFAKNSNYSLGGYAYRLKNKKNHLFYASVLLGKEYDSNLWYEERKAYQ